MGRIEEAVRCAGEVAGRRCAVVGNDARAGELAGRLIAAGATVFVAGAAEVPPLGYPLDLDAGRACAHGCGARFATSGPTIDVAFVCGADAISLGRLGRALRPRATVVLLSRAGAAAASWRARDPRIVDLAG